MPAITRRLALRAAVLGLAAVAAPGAIRAADSGGYLGSETIPLLDLLMPPPAKDSPTTKFEIAEIVKLQAGASDARKQRAIADDDDGLAQFLAGMGLEVDTSGLAASLGLFARIAASTGEVVFPAKDSFRRPRPPLLDHQIRPLIALPNSGAYPSGHSAVGTVTGIVLAKMLPEKKAAVFARIKDYAWSRAIAGVHYRSDLDAGFTAGSLIANALLHNPRFRNDFKPAKAELRRALAM